jgi:hypothetical protein
MRRFFNLLQVLVVLWAGAVISPDTLKAEDSTRFVAFSKAQLVGCKKWSKGSRDGFNGFLRDNEAKGNIFAYIVVPKPMIEYPEQKTSEANVWGIFESEPTSVSQKPLRGVGGYVIPLMPNDVQSFIGDLRGSYAQGELKNVYGEEVAVLDDLTLRDLLRLCLFNKSSPVDSRELRDLKSFANEFLISERKWLLSPEGNGRMVFISGLHREKEAHIRVFIPAQGTVASFRVSQEQDRATLRDALSILQGGDVPVTITLPIERVNALPDSFNLTEIARLLDVRLIDSKGDSIRGFAPVKMSDGKIYLFGTFSRDALDAKKVQIELSQGSPYRLVWKDAAGSSRIGSAQTFEIPEHESEVDASLLQFELAVARLPTDARLRSDDIWHHEVSFGEAQLSRDLPEIKERQIFFSADLKSPVDAELLFTDPVEYVRKLGSRIGRKVLGLEAREQRLFALEMAQTDSALEALWGYLQIARFLSKEHVEIVVVKNVPSPMRRWRWVASADHMSSWVTSYLAYRIRGEEQRSKKTSGISVREVEVPAQEDHITHTVSILLVPQQEKQEKSP